MDFSPLRRRQRRACFSRDTSARAREKRFLRREGKVEEVADEHKRRERDFIKVGKNKMKKTRGKRGEKKREARRRDAAATTLPCYCEERVEARHLATGRRRWTKKREQKSKNAKEGRRARGKEIAPTSSILSVFIIILRDDTCVTTRLRHEGSIRIYRERVFYSLVVREQVNIRPKREPLFFFQLIPARGRCRRCTFQNLQLLILSTCVLASTTAVSAVSDKRRRGSSPSDLLNSESS